MTYLSDRRKNKRNYIRYGIGIILFIFVVYTWPILRAKIYPNVEGVVVSYGGTKNGLSQVASSLGAYFSSRNSLLEKESTLLQSIERLENEVAERDATLKEIQLISASGSLHPETTLVLYPVMQDITRIYSTLILSKGFKDGVKEQSLVYIRGRQAVCMITEVYDRTSLCTLFSASSQKVEGVASSSITLFLNGAGGGSFVAEVPRETDITTGEIIFLKSDQTMKLGVVTEIIHDEQMSSWYVFVRGAYNPLTSNIFYMNQ